MFFHEGGLSVFLILGSHGIGEVELDIFCGVASTDFVIGGGAVSHVLFRNEQGDFAPNGEDIMFAGACMPGADEEVEEFKFPVTHGFGHFTERGTGGINDSEVRPHVL